MQAAPPLTTDASLQDKAQIQATAFINRWQGNTASELSTAQSFVRELCDLLGVANPHPTAAQDYMFERPITFAHGDGSSSAGRIDCYKHGHFVLEAKKTRLNAKTKGFDDALLRARAQGEGYARALPAHEGRPPFVLVVDVGTVIELYSEFTKSGATYVPFPDPRSHRIALADLVKPEIRQRLKLIWTDPLALDPSRVSASTTRDVAAKLAELAKSLEQSGHRADHVAAFLTRSLFSMFAEDVELLPKGSFLELLQKHKADPRALQEMLRALWQDMDQGGFSVALSRQVLRFNGKLFKEPNKDGYSLLLNAQQIAQLTRAAQANWREVEPAIFGTLLERALSPTERHALGAHYTPRAYVERLVLPTVVEPLRADWANAQAAAVLLASEAAELSGKALEAKMAQARAELKQFHHQLCTLRVLDPACGSGNFLYVTLEHLKRLEGEVINQLEAFGQTQSTLGLEGETVTPQQLLGIELNDRAAALAELVLWIGYLQWHIRTRGNKAVAEPVVHDYGNIECRDAVLAWADTDLAYDDGPNGTGQLLSRWDGKTFKTHPVTGALVPDEAAMVPQWRYIRPAQAKWPKADFIVGNPPFIGAKHLRDALGDGYAEALRKTWPEVPESADFVMHWWSRAALMVTTGKTRQFGLITTNSLRQTFNRRVVQAALDKNLQLTYAIPDHPWVDSANGAAVRIAMTVGAKAKAANLGSPKWGSDPEAKRSGSDPYFGDPNFAEQSAAARLLTLLSEATGDFGEVDVTLAEHNGIIHADLSVGTNVALAVPLESNANISSPGVKLHGAGFIVTPEEATAFKLQGSQTIIRDYRNGRDLSGESRNAKVIDAFGLSAEDLRTRYPAIYQRLYDRVRPEREQNNRATYRNNWWIFGEPRSELRPALANLSRYIATVVTSKHRVFQFLDASILADDALICIGSQDAFHLGVLSSELHAIWSLVQGGTLEDRPRYNKSRCFETFPFPDEDTGLTPEMRNQIAALAEQIDAHRKRQQAAHPGLTLTGMYNVLEILRQAQDERVLTAKEKTIHTQGLVGVLKELHDELDAAVLQAYGWSDLTLRQAQGERGGDELLTRLVALNAQRAAEEKTGKVRWLRPEFQNPALRGSPHLLSNQELLAPVSIGLQANLMLENEQKTAKNSKTTAKATQTAWPNTLPAQVSATAQLLASAGAALSLPDIEASFKGKGPWKKGLPRILETLEALGRARREEISGVEGWRAL